MTQYNEKETVLAPSRWPPIVDAAGESPERAGEGNNGDRAADGCEAPL